MRPRPDRKRRSTRTAFLAVGAAAALFVAPGTLPVAAQPPNTEARGAHPVGHRFAPDAGGGSAYAGTYVLDGTPAAALRTFSAGPVTTARATSTTGGRAVAEAAKTGSLELTPCPDDDTFLCGTLPVPLNRAHPDGRTVGIHVEVAPHTGSAPKGLPVFITSGGPGNSITTSGEKYGWRDYVLAPLAEEVDQVFIDQRGVGLSDAIDCPTLQHDASHFYAAFAACARQLGSDRNLYSSGWVADDIDDVRKALGYKKITFAGGSYAGNDATVYAARHTAHVRAVVAGSPYLPVNGLWDYGNVPRAVPAFVSAVCERSVTCERANPDPTGNLRWLVQRLRHDPVAGVGYDQNGDAHHVRLTEAWLVNAALIAEHPVVLQAAEITAAAASLRAGDPIPLLRLGAENDPATWNFDSGDPVVYSAGHNEARFCVDFQFPWDEQAPKAVRLAQFAQARAAAPDRYGIFSKHAWLVPRPLGSAPDPCIAATWRTQPSYPRHTVVHGVPSLVLAGDYDMVVPTADVQRARHVMAGATYYEIATAGHVPWWFRECAAAIVARFVATKHSPNLCAGDPLPKIWATGNFPTTVAAAPRARSVAGDESIGADRRMATVAVWSVLDTIHRMYDSGTQSGRGLRGGSTSLVYSEGPPTPDVFTLDHVRFTADSTVTGTGYQDWDGFFGGDVVVRGPGGGHGHFTFKGHWYGVDATVFVVDGTAGGRTVHVTVPAS